MKRNLTKTILAVALILSLCTATAFAAELPADVQGQPYESAVQTLMDEGVIVGDTDGLFHPESNLTRAQVCVMITKAMNPDAFVDSKYKDSPNSFSDMNGYGWAKPAINYAAEMGIANGYGDGTFKPGGNVTLAELLTFAVNACGVQASEMTGEWPSNYIAKAEEMNLLTIEQGKLTENVIYLAKTPASKSQAATTVFAGLEKIKSYGDVVKPKDDPQPKPPVKPDTKNFQYATIDFVFGDNGVTVNSIPVDEDVKVYTYSKAKEYSNTMTFPADLSNLPVEPVIKYKGVHTKGWYKLDGGKISEIILPTDVGFRGRALCVINSISTALNADDESVLSIDTLTAGESITWFSKAGVATYAGLDAAIQAGSLFELSISKGTVEGTIDLAPLGAAYPDVIERGINTGSWQEVKENDTSKLLIQLINGTDTSYYPYANNTAVYVLNDDKDGYEIGSPSSIKKGCKVRMYDFTDDDDDSANIILVQKK